MKVTRPLVILSRVAALGGTAWLLMAESPPPAEPCHTPVGAIAYRVEGGCGPGGIIVVRSRDNIDDPNVGRYSSAVRTTILDNPEALGFQAASLSGTCPEDLPKGWWGYFQRPGDAGAGGRDGSSSASDGDVPAAPRDAGAARDADANRDDWENTPGGGLDGRIYCRADVEGGAFVFTCPEMSATGCRATLIPLP